MTDTIITVQGEFSARYPAERATVRAAVQFDGEKRDAVFADALQASDAVRTLIGPLVEKDAGPITWWSSDNVRVWSERPWNNEGKQVAPVFHSAVDFTAKFRDFDALSRWVEAAVAIEGVTLGSVSWDLTEETKAAASTDARSRAVTDAVAKATTFAKAIGLGTVTAIALADPGMLGDSGSGNGGRMPGPMMRAFTAQTFDSGSAQLALKPEEIAVASTVDARFIAS